ncbi:MAG: nucleotide exchange factor GrpE [Defluviitaleaceae bacterium]|nr:nucleotide exchange factor GrpE [Defluviitaleaceae bacterium]
MAKKKKNALDPKEVESLFTKPEENTNPVVDEETSESNAPEADIFHKPADATDAADALNKYQRCLAEFDNFRKRTAKEMAVRYDDGIRATCEKLLPVVDNFDRALAAHSDKEDGFYKGIEMIARQFVGTFQDLGIKEIPADPGTTFDANLHYAVAHVEDKDFGENQIAATLQKGYMHKERVIRPTMVKVAN